MAVNDFVGSVLFGDGRCCAEVRTIREFERVSPILVVSVQAVDAASRSIIVTNVRSEGALIIAMRRCYRFPMARLANDIFDKSLSCRFGDAQENSVMRCESTK